MFLLRDRIVFSFASNSFVNYCYFIYTIIIDCNKNINTAWKKGSFLEKTGGLFTKYNGAGIISCPRYHLLSIADMRNLLWSASYWKFNSPLYFLTVFSALIMPRPCLFLSFFAVISRPSFISGGISQLFSISIKIGPLSEREKNTMSNVFSD